MMYDDVAAGESNLARRVARMRRQRKWSYGELARRLADAGCPGVPPNAVGRIERGERRVTFGEFLALAEVFGFEDPAGLLEDADDVETREANELVSTLKTTRAEINDAAIEFARAVARLRELKDSDPDAYEYVQHRLAADPNRALTKLVGVGEIARYTVAVRLGERLVNELLRVAWSLTDERAKDLVSIENEDGCWVLVLADGRRLPMEETH